MGWSPVYIVAISCSLIAISTFFNIPGSRLTILVAKQRLTMLKCLLRWQNTASNTKPTPHQVLTWQNLMISLMVLGRMTIIWTVVTEKTQCLNLAQILTKKSLKTVAQRSFLPVPLLVGQPALSHLTSLSRFMGIMLNITYRQS